MEKQKRNFSLGFILICIVYYGFLIAGYFLLKENLIYQSFNFFGDWEGYNKFLRILSDAIFIWTASQLCQGLLSRINSHMNKHQSVISLLKSFVKYIAAILFIFIALHAFGVNTATLLASAGILSLIVGLGAQSLIEDIIAGVFIVFENVFDYGDIVVIDDFRGAVEEIGIRTTKIKDTGGNIKVVNNSDIRTLINMTNELSLAISEVDVEYGESLARIENVIENNLDKIKEAIPDIVNGPYYKGVSCLGASGVRLRFIAECPEISRFQVERDLNRQIKLMFDQNDINIPFTQVVLHEAKEEETKKGNSEKADTFIEKQRNLSQHIGDEENL